MSTNFLKKHLLFLLFVSTVLIYFFSWFFVLKTGINTLAIQSEDTLPALFIPVTILKEGTLYADSYYQMILHNYPQPDDKDFLKGSVPFYYKKIGGHYVTAFPILAGLLAIPVYILPLLAQMPITFENVALLGHLTAAITVALSGLVLYKLLLRTFFENDNRKALFVTLFYLFGTINLSMLSQALWQYGTLELMVLLGLYYFYASSTSKTIFLSGLFFGLAVLARPTAILIFVLMALLLFIKTRNFKLLTLFVTGLLLCGVFFLGYTNLYFKDVANQGYSSQLTSNWLGRFPEGFLGIWFSPSKGILIYSPLFIMLFPGLYVLVKNKAHVLRKDYMFFWLIVLVHTLVMGKWKHWYGGYSYGYRMAADILPFLVLLLVPYMCSTFFAKTKKLFYGLLGISVLVHAAGIVFFDSIWHAAYDKGFKDTSWLWSLKDSEFAFNVRRVLVKLHFMQKACDQCL